MATIKVMERESNPLINIITRTNSRPNAFARCRQSVENQTYKKIRHIVCVDREEDLEYVNQYAVDSFLLKKEDFEDLKKDIPDPKTGGRFVYNLYFNYLISQVTDGWVIILDDDDFLNDDGVIETIVRAIEYANDMILWQMQYPNGIKLPSDLELNKRPQMARIGSPCFAVHSSIAKKIKWDGWKCGDFRFIDKVWNATNIKRWVRRPLVQIGTNSGGLGRRVDVKPQFRPVSQPLQVKKTTTPLPSYLNRNSVLTTKKTQPSSTLFSTKALFQTPVDVVIGINTFNRFEKITSLINTLESQQSKYSYKIMIMNDGSTDERYDETFKDTDKYIYIKNSINLKKEQYWVTINNLFNQVKKIKYDYFIQLDDDFSICNSFLDTIVNEFLFSPQNTLAIYLNKSKNQDKAGRWGYKGFVDGGSAYKRQGLELLDYVIKPIPMNRFRREGTKIISSGVWEQVTKRLNALQKDSIRVLEYALIHHDAHKDSKMNYMRNYDEKLTKTVITDKFLGKDIVPLVMCTWKRFENLKRTLDQLERQTNKNFSFNIWNNNLEIKDKINELLINSSYSYPIFVTHSEENVGGFGRFYYAKELIKNGHDKVIFFDDDESFDQHMVQTLLNEYEPRTVKSRWCWHLRTRYWDRVQVEPGKNEHLQPKYCGTNGMICDISFFSDENLFKCPKEYWFIEDLWLSYYARIVKGFKLKPSGVKMDVTEDGKGQYHALVPKKDQFYYFLEKNLTEENWQKLFEDGTIPISAG